jgi:hypothetical protein
MEADGLAGGDFADAEFAEFYRGSYARIVTLVAVLLGDERADHVAIHLPPFPSFGVFAW